MVVEIAFGPLVIHMRALIPVGTAKMTRDPISRLDVLDGQSLACEETDVAVKIPSAGQIQLGPEVIALCGGVIGNDMLASGKKPGRGEKQGN
jgi:hypothetical protein